MVSTVEERLCVQPNTTRAGKLRFYSGSQATAVADAHEGAITCVRWNQEGTSVLSAGEDGIIKQWSAKGNLRSRLVHSDVPIHCLAWSPDHQSVAYTHGRE